MQLTPRSKVRSVTPLCDAERSRALDLSALESFILLCVTEWCQRLSLFYFVVTNYNSLAGGWESHNPSQALRHQLRSLARLSTFKIRSPSLPWCPAAGVAKHARHKTAKEPNDQDKPNPREPIVTPAAAVAT